LSYTPDTKYFGNINKEDTQINLSNILTNIQITPVNDVPSAYDDSILLNEDIEKQIVLKATDIDQDIIEFVIIKNPEKKELLNLYIACIFKFI